MLEILCNLNNFVKLCNFWRQQEVGCNQGQWGEYLSSEFQETWSRMRWCGHTGIKLLPFIPSPLSYHLSPLNHHPSPVQPSPSPLISREAEEVVHLSMVNSGGIRASFDKGNITMEDLLMSFPFRSVRFKVLTANNCLLFKIWE